MTKRKPDQTIAIATVQHGFGRPRPSNALYLGIGFGGSGEYEGSGRIRSFAAPFTNRGPLPDSCCHKSHAAVIGSANSVLVYRRGLPQLLAPLRILSVRALH